MTLERAAHQQQIADVLHREQPDQPTAVQHRHGALTALAHALEGAVQRFPRVGGLTAGLRIPGL